MLRVGVWARARAGARARARVRVRLEHRDEADRGLGILVGRDRVCSARLPARRPLLLHTRFGLCATAGAASQERYAGASAAKSGMRVRAGAAHNPAGHGGPRRRSAAPAWATRVVRCASGGGLVACAADAEVKVEMQRHGARRCAATHQRRELGGVESTEHAISSKGVTE